VGENPERTKKRVHNGSTRPFYPTDEEAIEILARISELQTSVRKYIWMPADPGETDVKRQNRQKLHQDLYHTDQAVKHEMACIKTLSVSRAEATTLRANEIRQGLKEIMNVAVGPKEPPIFTVGEIPDMEEYHSGYRTYDELARLFHEEVRPWILKAKKLADKYSTPEAISKDPQFRKLDQKLYVCANSAQQSTVSVRGAVERLVRTAEEDSSELYITQPNNKKRSIQVWNEVSCVLQQMQLAIENTYDYIRTTAAFQPQCYQFMLRASRQLTIAIGGCATIEMVEETKSVTARCGGYMKFTEWQFQRANEAMGFQNKRRNRNIMTDRHRQKAIELSKEL